MPKNIVVYSDGTDQDGRVRVEQRVSNVYKMYLASRVHGENQIDPADQVCFYDPGLETGSSAAGLTGIARRIDKLLQSITGRSITKNMIDCYEFITNQYESGDRIYLIGFSRGAYAVRSLSNTLMLCGIPTKGEHGPLLRNRKQVRDIAKEAIETVYEHGAGHARKEFELERDELARRFRAKYGSGFVGEDDDKDRSNAAAYFIGVFDTVAALGASGLRRFLIQLGFSALFVSVASAMSAVIAILPSLFAKQYYGFEFWWTELVLSAELLVLAICWFIYRQEAKYTKTIYDFPNKGDKRSHQAEWKSGNFDRLLSRYVGTARSANAIDEHRKDFDRVTWDQENSSQLSQWWFAGNHSDIGGSYPEIESRLSDISLEWMLQEILKLNHPIKFGPIAVDGKRLAGTGSAGIPLNLFPDVAAMQHCEIADTRDMIDTFRERLSWVIRWALARANYATTTRSILPNAMIHPSVRKRFDLETVVDCGNDEVQPYRPEALRGHNDFKEFYKDFPPEDISPPATNNPPPFLILHP